MDGTSVPHLRTPDMHCFQRPFHHGFLLPGAIGAHLAHPDRKVLAVMGDGSFLMNSQEMETAVRENIPLKILVWVDDSYGLIKWKMDMESGSHDRWILQP